MLTVILNVSIIRRTKIELDLLDKDNLLWKPRTLGGPSVAQSTIDGKKVVMLCSNNYLGLANHKALRKAAINAIRTHGAGSGSVRPIAGTMDIHLKLEELIAKFKHTEAALYYNTGFTANSGALPALLREGDAVISDSLNHGSIIDGLRLSQSRSISLRTQEHARFRSKIERSEN